MSGIEKDLSRSRRRASPGSHVSWQLARAIDLKKDITFQQARVFALSEGGAAWFQVRPP